MNKIINGKRYDTDRASLVGEDSYSNSRDFNHWHEALYQKRTGEFFLYGEGGPMSKYAETIGQNEWSGGEKIMPLSVEAAKKWAEEHLTGDEYEKIFSVDDEGGEKTVTSFSLKTSTVKRLRAMAEASSRTMGDVIDDLVSKENPGV